MCQPTMLRLVINEVNIGYTEIQQTCPQTGTGQTVSFTVAVKSKATTSLILTFTLSANACIGTLGVNVAMINNPLVDAGISYVDTSGTSNSFTLLSIEPSISCN